MLVQCARIVRAYSLRCRLACAIEKQLTNFGQLSFQVPLLSTNQSERKVIGTAFVTADSAGKWGLNRRYGH